MIQKIKFQSKKHNAFTLIEMLIVLIVMWIMLMVTLFLSWDQIQRVKDKTVKESILAEMQSRYSRNLWSSSFAWIMYNHLDVSISAWSNKIDFKYNPINDSTGIQNTFTDNFKMMRIYPDYNFDGKPNMDINAVTLQYTPYKISCDLINWENNLHNVVLITRVNDSKNYCFEIKQKNCRLVEVSEEKCTTLKTLVEMPD
jgi:prepilin-type N-terminal cleavage/methylation domain-containing protein